MTSAISSNITILKKNNIQNETISYKNQKFQCVGFWGKVWRVLSSLFCKDGFKDCKAAFITQKMVEFYNTNAPTMPESSRKAILKTIHLYAKKKHTEHFFKKIQSIKEKTLPKSIPSTHTGSSPTSQVTHKGTSQAKGDASSTTSESDSPTSNTPQATHKSVPQVTKGDSSTTSESDSASHSEHKSPSQVTKEDSSTTSESDSHDDKVSTHKSVPQASEDSHASESDSQTPHSTHKSVSQAKEDSSRTSETDPSKASSTPKKNNVKGKSASAKALPTPKISVDWDETLGRCKKKQLSREELLKRLKTGDTSALSPNKKVKIHSYIIANPGDGDKYDTMKYLGEDTNGALTKYLIQKIAQKPLDISNAIWEEVIKYISIPNDSFSNVILKSIAEKDPKGLSESNALIIVDLLLEYDEDLAHQFTRNLELGQIGAIIKKHSEMLLLSAIEESTFIALCEQKYDAELLKIFLENYEAPLSEKMLPKTTKEIWDDLFLHIQLGEEELLVISEQIAKNGIEPLEKWGKECADNEMYQNNMAILRELGHNVVAEGVDNHPVIQLLNAIEPENAQSYVVVRV